MTTDINDYSAAKDALTRLTLATYDPDELDHIVKAMRALADAEIARLARIQADIEEDGCVPPGVSP